jgi:DNA modification methylase
MVKLTIMQGNTFELLPTIPSDSIDLVITSPPYWGLRAYGTSQQIFGGTADCQHEFEEFVRQGIDGGKKNVAEIGNFDDKFVKPSIQGKCLKCGAWRGEYGSEPTMEAYLDNTMKWVKEVWRVLKPTGSFVLNMGDCFFTKRNDKAKEQVENSLGYVQRRSGFSSEYGIYKTKQLLSVSSFAYCRIVSETDFVCRGEHIWAKPNVPSPIRSRLKHSHEKLFWFVKDAEQYHFDKMAWMHPTMKSSDARNTRAVGKSAFADNIGLSETSALNGAERTHLIGKDTIEHSWRWSRSARRRTSSANRRKPHRCTSRPILRS